MKPAHALRALRAVAGFVKPSSGRILIGDRDVTHLAPYDRKIGMVVQNYALFPHMRVEENVAFGLRAHGVAEDAIKKRVPECLAMVGCVGEGTAPKFAEICCATVLAGEISIIGAMSAGDFGQAHAKYGRRTQKPEA